MVNTNQSQKLYRERIAKLDYKKSKAKIQSRDLKIKKMQSQINRLKSEKRKDDVK